MTGDVWDDPRTAAAYRRFCARHDRYRRVAAALADALDLPTRRRVLEVGAGTGVTSRALLRDLPTGAVVDAVEPAGAMRAASTLRDRRLRWHAEIPDGRYDAVVCSAALWLLGPLPDALDRLLASLAPDGVLGFTVPSAYLGLPDGDPGDRPGALDGLLAAFLEGRTRAPEPAPAPPDHAALAAALRAAGRSPTVTEVRVRWTLATQEDWLRLPPVGLALRPDLAPETLDATVDAAVAAVGRRRGHRTERWTVWTAT
ncbi:MAG: class I SAM-dependent methyltransferase [Alphaproteobacteria bacterium]|nr:class I SAM-dependent methyltransferase [Alphaproteobacteria bacterium]